ncbi:chromosome segregation protein SMC [Candidatus Magnetominusculus xianensis]|uniref:Chromosome partition protein Smc n=1 Tax=Candidatus Magnetominusculus xianensis TaxID=1748249 RepID=A0ABR5SEM2_9BACT|nr:chromosome segregation protein SMC [Candidatus Magnetominusculus xianensis]KWT84934.1 chromosome segregation protein SMC [Candidatus Magnetominusculus xianensis]MBF0404484.1 chromosome segregation protein SMC [Nitrospirota bacterium]
MRIVKLEINGFKSFADKTVFSMHPGTTCIVGPNGCGKSNVVDAFRWVLGEQNAKTLRGEKMEEIIFNGTSEVKAKGMAEAVLYFTGSADGNGSSGTDNIVEVARRLYRSGESEYYINKTRCRLKDVREIFLDTGLEVRSYSILEQGRISEILNTKPIERRFLIEEVAGVMKYKVRKSEAIAKIERSRANLDRINDIVSEVKRSISSLDRQVKKAEKFKALTTELSLIELKIAKRDYALLMDTYTRLTSEIETLSAELQVTAAGISEKDSAREAASRVIEEKQKALDTLSQSQRELDRDLSMLEKDIAVKRSAIDNISGHTERLKAQISSYCTEKDEAAARVTELSQSETELGAKCDDLDKAIETDKAKLIQTEESLDGVEEELREKNRSLFKVSDEISTIRNEIARIQSTAGSLKQKKDSAASFFKHAATEHETHEIEIKKSERTILQRQESIDANKKKKELLAGESESLQKEIDSTRAEIASMRESLAGDTSRLKSLEEVTAAELNVKEFTQNIEVMALVSNIIDVPRKYETAVEAALGRKIKGFIVRDFEALKNGVRFLKERASERTSLVVNTLGQSAEISSEASGGVNAFSVVKTPPEYTETIRAILGHYIIVDDMQRALYQLSKGSSFHFATLDGDIVEPSGVVTTGKSGTILKHLRNIRELKEKTAASSIALNALQGRLNSSLQRRETLKKEQQTIDNIISAMDKELSILKLNLKKHTEDKDRLTQKLHYMKVESEQTDKEITALNEKLSQRHDEEKLVQTRKEEINSYIEELRDTVTDKKVHLETLRASFTEKKASITGMRERLRAARAEKTSHTKKIETLEQRISDADKETGTLTVKQEALSAEIQTEEKKLALLTENADALKSKILEQKTQIEADIKIVHEFEAALGMLRHKHEQTRGAVTELELRLTESRMRIENIQGIVTTNYGKTIDELQAPPLAHGEEEKTAVLKRKISEIGPVNLASIEEYEVLTTRYDFLLAQQNDLLTSIAELEEAIAKINSTTRQKLTDGFNMLNLKFDETFKKFFGGGRAELILTETTNILECGIDIVVQPPQKKLQNINLLSGGEKTLSAISLVFAGFLIKPTPMCILDEADAALDDSNTVRFASMLKELAEKTQFIVITHNRVTMESADYIYGVTNEIPGVSKVISMELTAAVSN